MSDWLVDLAQHPFVARLLAGLDLPAPVRLARAEGPYRAAPLAGKALLLASAPRGFAGAGLARAVESAGGHVLQEPPAAARLDVVVFDATGLRRPADLHALYGLFHPLVRRIAPCGRVLVAAADSHGEGDAVAAACARGVEGFVRTLAREIARNGAQANLLYVASDAQDRLEGPLRYLCSAHSAYVDGQPLRIDASVRKPPAVPQTTVLEGRVAVVTGAARGIGAATAARLAEEGAHVLCIDVPQSGEPLEATARACGGSAFTLDITSADAPDRLVERLRTRHGGVDVVVHNAGITRDRSLANMTAQQWDDVCAVNFGAITRLDEALCEGAMRDDGRIVCLSSLSGIAGNYGQANYATTKAALIGWVAARAPRLAARGICINAIAPGFIETRMTEAIPFAIREMARRLCSLRQGGLPRDVAEAISFLASPGACGVTGQTLRVCGQGWLGA
jgi:3-oxoacyl-[acyl-carrier protein] reductase